MYFSDIITLVSHEKSQDEIGNEILTDSEREVFCDISKVGQNEFFKAATADLKAELKATVFNSDYQGEKDVILSCDRFSIKNKKYSVYRTYPKNEEQTELYLCDRIGG